MIDETNKEKPIMVQSQSNHLFGKVVLLVSNDTLDLPPLVTQLARRGADIALICQQVSQGTIRLIKKSVETLGRRFLLIENPNEPETTTDQLVQSVASKLNQLDLFIDLTGPKKPQPPANDTMEKPEGWLPPNWKLLHAALEEITKPN